MTLPTVFLIAIALGTDAFSMAIGVGLSGVNRRRILATSLVIALFHIFMPLTGLLLGSWLGKTVGQLASYIGAVVLIFIGFQMLREGINSNSIQACQSAQTTIPMQVYSGLGGMLVLSCSVSLDALTVGFGLGTLQVNLALTVIIMGVVAGLMTLGGFFLGKKIGPKLGEKAEILGGIILIIIGVKMFF